MKNKQLYLIAALVIIFLFVVSGVSKTDVANETLGGSYSYNSTTTDATTWANPSKSKLLKTGSGKLARVIVTGATSASALNFYDATTTLPHPDHASTTIAAIGVSTPAGTYEFEVPFERGLLVEFPTNAVGMPQATITWE